MDSACSRTRLHGFCVPSTTAPAYRPSDAMAQSVSASVSFAPSPLQPYSFYSSPFIRFSVQSYFFHFLSALCSFRELFYATRLIAGRHYYGTYSYCTQLLTHSLFFSFFYYWSLWTFIWLGALFFWVNGEVLSLHSWIIMVGLYSSAMFAFWKTKQRNRFAPVSQRIESVECDKVGEANLCRFCYAERVALRRHCRVCNGCVDARDHHCVW